MIKFIKKAVSAFLATVMCIPAGLVNIASAEENDTDTVTTVTLSDTDNGLMQFSEECMKSSTAKQDGYQMLQVDEDGQMNEIKNDGSIWAFNAGDKVEVELLPDEEYNVKSFTIKDSSSGDVMAHKETMDNVFSFVMPGKSLTVEAVFSNSSTVEIVQGEELSDGEELDVESKYHDITETSEVTQEEVEEVIFDLATESYIKANLNPAYMTVSGKAAPVDALSVKHTLFDGRYVEDGDTIDSIMNSIEAEDDPDYEKNEMKVISQVGALSYIYDFDENSDYYVTYANTMIKDEEYTVQDWAFAYNDFSGRSLDGCVYDNETGLLYIPKALYDQLNEEEGGEGIAMMSLQVQFMQVYYDKDTMEGLSETEVPDMQSDVCTVDVNDDESAIDVNTDTQDIFSLETTTTVNTGMDTENLNVAVNGMIVPEEVYEYDPDTGSLTVEMSPASVVSVEAWEGEKTVQEQLIDLTTDDVQALTYNGMKPLAIVKLNSKAAVQKITKDDRIMKLYGTLTYKNSATHATGDEPYYITADGPGDYMDANIRLANWLTDNDRTLSYANIKPHQIGPGSDMYIGSNLSNYKLVNKDQKWIHNYSKFLKKIKIQSTCMHIERAYLGESGASNKARFNVRIVKVWKSSVKKKTVGKTTKYKQNGYIVFGLLSPKICKQTTCNLLKVKFDASWKKTESPDDPLKLFLYKAEDGAEEGTEEDGVEEGTEEDGVEEGTEEDGVEEPKFPYASLGNATFTVLGLQNNIFKTR